MKTPAQVRIISDYLHWLASGHIEDLYLRLAVSYLLEAEDHTHTDTHTQTHTHRHTHTYTCTHTPQEGGYGHQVIVIRVEPAT